MLTKSAKRGRDAQVLAVFAAALAFLAIPQSVAAQRLASYGSLDLNRIPPNGWENPTIVDPGGWTTINVASDSRLTAAQRLIPNDSSQDAAAKIAAILNATNGLGNRKLYFPAGSYHFKSHLVISTSNVWLYGDGPTTRFLLQQTSAPGHIAFVGSSSSGTAPTIGDLSGTTALTSAPASGANAVTVQDVSSFRVGDLIDVFQDTTPEVAADTWGREAWGQLAKVTAIDASARRLTLDSKLALAYNSGKRPRVRRIIPVRNITLKSVHIERTVDNNEINGVRLVFCENCFIADVESYKASDRAHVYVAWSYRVVVAQSSFTGSWDASGGGSAYGVSLVAQSTKVKVSDNWFRDLRHHIILQSGANHNVISYNSAEPTYYDGADGSSGSDLSLHGNWAHHNLFEGNQFNESQHDGDHGDSGPLNTFFRNSGARVLVTYNDTDQNNVIGNLLSGRISYRSESTGNYTEGNQVAGNVAWNTLSSSASIPTSLYTTTKPAFLGSKPWPLFGPGVTSYGAGNSTPAADRSP